MSTIEEKPTGNLSLQTKSTTARQVDAIAWAVLLIWIGIALLTDLGWGWALLGTSAIILGAQGIISQRGEPVEGFAVLCGIVFLIGGTWIIFGLTWPLAPVLLILLGAGLLWNALFGTQTKP